MPLFTLDELAAATATSCAAYRAADAGLCLAAAAPSGSALTVVVKHENHTPTGVVQGARRCWSMSTRLCKRRPHA